MSSRLASVLVVALLAVALVPSAEASGASWRPEPFRAADESKLTPTLERELADPQGPQRVWVFFADKGLTSRADYDAAIAGVAESYDRRAVQRRRLRGTVGRDDGTLFDFADLPLRESYVTAISETGAKVRVRSRWLNAVSAVATKDQIGRIAALPFVTRLQLVAKASRPEPLDVREAPAPTARAIPRTLDYGRSTDQLTQMNLIALHDAGYTGEGVVVGILDTGFRRDHDAFNQAGHEVEIIAEYDFVDDDADSSNEPGDPSNQHHHGTLILGTLGSYYPGELVGGAYDAAFVLAKTEDTLGEYQGEEDNYVAGLQFIEENGADLATSSLGYIDWYTQSDLDGVTAVTTIAVNIAADRGLHMVTAAGNEYHDSNPATSSLIAPADAFKVITAGAVTSSGTISSFSSEGPTADGRVKPELLARGSGTQTVSSGSTTAFSSADGTSLSTPLLAGSLACLVQAHPNWSVDTMRDNLFLWADYDVGGLGFDPLYVRGYGIVDAMATHENSAGLHVGPGSDLVSEGPEGGPFDPTSLAYTLGNNEAFPLDYSVSADQGWVDVSNASGTIPGEGSVEVVVSLNAGVDVLAQGHHEATVSFLNTTDHEGDTERSVVLDVGRTIIGVSPDEMLDTVGPLAGPFVGSRVYTVTSERPTAVDVRVSAGQSWIAIDGTTAPLEFTLEGVGASREVVVGISAMANVLSQGSYAGGVVFENLTSGEGSSARGVALEVGGPQPIFAFDFDSDPGWTTTGDWEFGQPTGEGSHSGDPTSGHTGANVYGYNLEGDYTNNMPEQYLTSAALDCTGLESVEVGFRRWLGVESATWDNAAFQASNDGSSWTTLWSNSSVTGSIDESEWSRVDYSISAIADDQKTVYLRWVIGATDSSVTYPGWNIDDVEIRSVVEVEKLTLLLGGADLIWTPLPQTIAFDVVRGDLGALRASGGDFALATGGCMANDVGVNNLAHTGVPAASAGYWYLVRGLTAGGPMSYESLSDSQVGTRDDGIAASGAACP